jgi:MFS family permease
VSTIIELLAIPDALGSVLGPTVSGGFGSLVSWRWIRQINMPLLVILFSLIAVFLGLRSPQNSPLCELRRFDKIDVLLFGAEVIMPAFPLI